MTALTIGSTASCCKFLRVTPVCFAHAAAYGRGMPATGRAAYGAVAPPAAPPVAAAGALGAGRGALSAYSTPAAAGEYLRYVKHNTR